MRTIVFDDDPTGSQAVHDVAIAPVIDIRAIEEALRLPASTCFVLTNTRSLDEPEAVRLTTDLAGALFGWAIENDQAVEIVSRGDSTLRGHVIAEVQAINGARRAAYGSGYDGVLLVPAFFEAGRSTSGDIQWVRVGDSTVPMGETEFARDLTFGYSASNLRDFVAEKSAGAIGVPDVLSISLEDIRKGGVPRVSDLLRHAHGCQFVVVNCTEYSDLDTVVLAVHALEQEGRRFLYRTGPSFVRSLIGQEGHPALTSPEIWGTQRRPGHGIVVVGSHVGQTAHQIDALRSLDDLAELEVSVADVIDPVRREGYLASLSKQVIASLATMDVVLYTSREVVRGGNARDSLRVAREVSSALVELVKDAVGAKPAWMIAKGGITSHDIAVHAVGMRSAVVLGQLFPGMVSVLRLTSAPEAVIGMPYVIFAGNVGGTTALRDSVETLRGEGFGQPRENARPPSSDGVLDSRG